MEYILWTITVLVTIVSFFCNRKRTYLALKIAIKRMWKISSIFLLAIALFALSITAIPPSFLEQTIGSQSGLKGFFIATLTGSVSLMPGFVAFPLGAALKAQGIPYFILAAFTTTLMNVGVITFPLEKQYLGWKVALIRNLACLIITALVTLAIAVAFGEVKIWN